MHNDLCIYPIPFYTNCIITLPSYHLTEHSRYLMVGTSLATALLPHYKSSKIVLGTGYSMSDWNPEEVKKALDTELTVEGIHSHREITARKLREAAPLCADSLTHLALWSTNESVRLKAAAEVLNRVYGKTSDQGMRTSEDIGSVEEVVNDLYDAPVRSSSN